MRRVSMGAREIGEANASHRGGRELADGVLELVDGVLELVKAAAQGRRRS